MKRVDFNDLEEVQDELGLWIVVDESGKPFTGIVTESFEDETLSYEGYHINGRICGYEKRWHENGQLKYFAQKFNNATHGISKEWYEDGTISFEAKYKYGSPICYKMFNPDGSLTKEYNINDDPEMLSGFKTLEKRIVEKGLAEK
jgi:antitoxin component YwqK of YwqJK toxin-antitoxin module